MDVDSLHSDKLLYLKAHNIHVLSPNDWVSQLNMIDLIYLAWSYFE